MAGAQVITVDGAAFKARFAGFGAPLAVTLPGGGEAELLPWTLRDHLGALRHCLEGGPEGLALDAEGLAGAVLAKSGLTGEAAAALGPLALWWAAGGGQARAAEGEGPWTDLGTARAQLRAWTEGERQAALRAHLAVDPDGAPALDAVGYLEAMLDASLVAIEPGPDAGDCDAAAGAALLAAVTALNTPGAPAEGGAPLPVDRALASSTLRICRALGWTPSQVWAAPAAEVARIAALLDLVEPEAPAAASAIASEPLPGHSALALQPDAIVIQIEDEGS